MKKVILTTVAVLFAAAVYAGMGDVLTSWPAPGEHTGINGIAFEGDYIWLKDRDCEFGSVMKCNTSGSVVKEIGFPYHGSGPSNGLAFDGTYLWTIYFPLPGPVRRDHYVKYTTAGSEAGGFAVHPDVVYWPSVSVSWDGQYLWTDERPKGVDKKAGKYTTAGSLLGTFSVPGKWGTDAAYYNDQLWYGTSYPYDTVFGGVIGGDVVASFPAPGGSSYAVGFDGEYLWTADRNKPQYIYKVDIEVVGVAPASLGKVKALFR
ncbi:MAG: hypothetical protein GTN49_09475 [candidate division Zixibacteria bacterium]|nr:hypothetical protein [candidate division Zixibacteria bacterium]